MNFIMKRKTAYWILIIIGTILSFVPIFPYLPPCPPTTDPCMLPMEKVSLVGFISEYILHII